MERAPGEYDFSGYRELLEEVKAAGLKLQAVLSFHACGNNVGDTAEIPLPEWVLEAARGASPPFYSDGRGLEPNLEYVSLWADEAEGLLRGRSPLQCYRDFMLAFRRALGPDLGGAVSEVVVGLGPSGELRFPAYSEQVRSPRARSRDGGDSRTTDAPLSLPLSQHGWRFPGVGTFQCHDGRAKEAFARAAAAAGREDWARRGPPGAASWHPTSAPEATDFFREADGQLHSDFGRFFMVSELCPAFPTRPRLAGTPPWGRDLCADGGGAQAWYAEELVAHGDRVLGVAREALGGAAGVVLTIKVAGIHWHYAHRSHAAELTAGYFNTDAGEVRARREEEKRPSSSSPPPRDPAGRRSADSSILQGYGPLCRLCRRHGAMLTFTCAEMCDAQHDPQAACSPERLLRDLRLAAAQHGLPLAGENALPVFFPGGLDACALDRIVRNAWARDLADAASDPTAAPSTAPPPDQAAAGARPLPPLARFTFLRLVPEILAPQPGRLWADFMRGMRGGAEDNDGAGRVAVQA